MICHIIFFKLATEDAFRQPWYDFRQHRNSRASIDQRSSASSGQNVSSPSANFQDFNMPGQPNIDQSQVIDAQNSNDPHSTEQSNIDDAQVSNLQDVNVINMPNQPNVAESQVIDAQNLNEPHSSEQSNTGDSQASNFEDVNDVNIPVQIKVEIDEMAEMVSMIEGHSYTRETHTYHDDDIIEMTWDHFPQPLKATEGNIIKRECDEFSGDIPFNNRVGLFRF